MFAQITSWVRTHRSPIAGTFVAVLSITALIVGEHPLLILALCGTGFVLAGPWKWFAPSNNFQDDPVTSLPNRDAFVTRLGHELALTREHTLVSGAILIEIDRFKLIEERHNRQQVEFLLRVVSERIVANLRFGDTATRLEGPTFGLALGASPRLNLEAAIQLSARVQQAIAESIVLDGVNIYLTASIGFSLSNRSEIIDGDAMLQTAMNALIEAQRFAPAAIRSYSPAMRDRIENRNSLTKDVTRAIEHGEINAYFQPQVSAVTGEITGFETLARWQHPKRGLIPPAEFLPALGQAGLMSRLGDKMINDALDALHRWETKGFYVPRVGVNFSGDELADPDLVTRLADRLDQYDLAPERLSIEVLETVVADHADDMVLRNLSALSHLGCRLDLDDFGTGHASITSIRRYSVERIKIDRSFITRIDNDIEQRKMVEAILTMAERLGLDTLAEGVETKSERMLLAKMGCGHVQGYGIARPLPPHEVDSWLMNYQPEPTGHAAFRRRLG